MYKMEKKNWTYLCPNSNHLTFKIIWRISIQETNFYFSKCYKKPWFLFSILLLGGITTARTVKKMKQILWFWWCHWLVKINTSASLSKQWYPRSLPAGCGTPLGKKSQWKTCQITIDSLFPFWFHNLFFFRYMRANHHLRCVGLLHQLHNIVPRYGNADCRVEKGEYKITKIFA